MRDRGRENPGMRLCELKEFDFGYNLDSGHRYRAEKMTWGLWTRSDVIRRTNWCEGFSKLVWVESFDESSVSESLPSFSDNSKV